MVRDAIFLADRYEVIEKIGSGGMADVYKGKDHKLNRLVAIKVLKKEFREDEEFVRKFKYEAQNAAGLLHPNVVNVYDVGEDRGLYFMVMELVDGITLKEYIGKKGKLSSREAINIAIQMLQGIGAAHQAHIVHRDIKPQNIIISRDGKVKVTDFGIAKMVSSHTVANTAMGSVHYSSPEQARGRYSDTKSDIYSFGITLYEMVTGKVPFDGETTLEVAMKHLKEPIVPPTHYSPYIYHSLEMVILKCTQKEPERRYPDTDEVIEDLKRSLIEPDGDFVFIPPLATSTSEVINLDDDDWDKTRSFDDDFVDELDDDELVEDEDTAPGFGKKRGKKKGGRGEEINSSMNKVVKVLMIVLAVIIGIIIIVVAGNAIGGCTGPGTTDSSGKVKVPDVVGKSEDDAISALNKRNLGYQVVERAESEEYDEGIVFKQGTEAGKKVKKNTRIKIWISSGKKGENVTVPDVVGKDEDTATQELADLGFETTVDYQNSDEVEEGKVISTSPAAGTEAEKGSTVTVVVSKGEESKYVTIPDVVGMNVNDATAALTAAGINQSDITTTFESSETVGKNEVISQTPGSGKAPEGTTVSITVSTGPKDVSVTIPTNIVGNSQSNATSILQGAGLNVNVVYANSEDEDAGKVVKVSPGQGSKVKPGATITITVGQGSGTQGGNTNQ
ncbi:MAG: Stk1 family PASTA domain-containing Ser/Thr kinase [Lachnospiraceae bacterium]|jgi:serine/threonine-protein kinase|nr:Stk1 family PASTA domain-containing Ser/Thr kinase [Lachnospiraceae bacterium]